MVSAAPALMKRFLLWAECSLGLLQAGAPLCLRVFHSTVLSAELGTRHTVLNNGLEWGRAVFRRAAETRGLPRVQGALGRVVSAPMVGRAWPTASVSGL